MIIGVSGKAGAGKDEFCHVGVRAYGAGKVAFADAVKEEVAGFLSRSRVTWEHRHLYGSQADKEERLRISLEQLQPQDRMFLQFATRGGTVFSDYSFTPRDLLQWWGTEYRRAQDSDYWVKQGMAKCRGRLTIIPDMRFPDEARAIRDAGGKLIRIERAGALSGSNPQHPSETALDDWDDWDLIIDNNDSLDDYHFQCAGAICSALDGSL